MTYDVAVIGGGMVGTAIAYGCAARGARTALVDQGDLSLRAARANAGLIYSQGKGEGMPAYAAWTRHSISLWPTFAEAMASVSGRDIGFRQRGVLAFCLGEEELETRRALLHRMHNQIGGPASPVHLVDRRELEAMLPDVRLGERVAGATYSPEDCDVNALPLLRALYTGFLAAGGVHLPERTVGRITTDGGGFAIVSDRDTVHADKVVVACGLGIPTLAPMVGLHAPVHPVRGQMIVTERLAPMLPIPGSGVRQIREGVVQIGTTMEEGESVPATSVADLARMASRAAAVIPALSAARIVRGWAGIRPMTPDGFPIYQQSPSHPGAYVAVCHSGVTLCAAHAGPLAEAILAGRLPDNVADLHPDRFDVHTA
ncbi:MAG: FAD-binding oxidoreductase [Acetobacteraceae bacterium]|nr:FAD-binding oxidoreductase [Acetobacteraceae bacterium]